MKNSKLLVLFLILLMIAVSSCEKKQSDALKIISYGDSQEINTYINMFREENPDIKVNYLDYEEEYGSDGLTKIKTDIVSGKNCDILISAPDFDVSQYSNKGMFSDLKKFEGFDEIKEKLLPNIYESIDDDGKIYSLYPNFYLTGVKLAKQKNIDENDWNKANILKLLDECIENETNLLGNHSDSFYQQMISQMIEFDMIQNNHLDEEWYKSLFEKCKLLAEIEKNNRPDYDNERLYREDKVVCCRNDIMTFDEYYYYEKAIFGDKICVLDSVNEKNTVNISSSFVISVFSISEKQQEAWDFIRFFFKDDIQKTTMSNYSFPVFKNAFNDLFEAAVSKDVVDPNGKVIGEKDGKVFFDNKEIDIGIPQKSDLKDFYDLLTSINTKSVWSVDIRNVINENMVKYFNNTISTDELYKNVNNIVLMYWGETRS